MLFANARILQALHIGVSDSALIGDDSVHGIDDEVIQYTFLFAAPAVFAVHLIRR